MAFRHHLQGKSLGECLALLQRWTWGNAEMSILLGKSVSASRCSCLAFHILPEKNLSRLGFFNRCLGHGFFFGDSLSQSPNKQQHPANRKKMGLTVEGDNMSSLCAFLSYVQPPDPNHYPDPAPNLEKPAVNAKKKEKQNK